VTAEISVVIPTLGRPSLERSIASIAAQSLQPRELIVVGNGSERLDERRLDRLRDMLVPIPLRSLSLPPFSGPSMSRNLGAWNATMPYVAFLDDDDEFSSGYIAEIWAVICRTSPDVVYGTVAGETGGSGKWGAASIPSMSGSALLDSLYRHNNPGFGGSNIVVKRGSFFDLGGFPVDLLSGEDRAFAMAALSAGFNVLFAKAAVVYAHSDADGYRASKQPDKLLTNLKLMGIYWSDVSWRARLRSVWRVSRSLLKRQRVALISWIRGWT